LPGTIISLFIIHYSLFLRSAHKIARKSTTKIAHTQIFEHKNEENRILFYSEGTIMHLGART